MRRHTHTMNRVAGALLAGGLMFSFTACGSDDDPDDRDEVEQELENEGDEVEDELDEVEDELEDELDEVEDELEDG